MDRTTAATVARCARRTFQMGCLAAVATAAAGPARAFDGTAAAGASPLSALVMAAFVVAVVLGVMALLRRAGMQDEALELGPPASERARATPPAARRPPVAKAVQPRAPTFRPAPGPAAGPAPSAAPELELIPYDAVMQTYVARQPEPAKAVPAVQGAEANRQRILARYIGARFPGVAARSDDFLDVARVVKAARLFLEDGRIERAVELLQLATEANAKSEEPWLAMLEILFIGSDAPGYARAARLFAGAHPRSAHWPVVRQLGRRLGLDDAVIVRGMSHVERYPNYGPWRGLPNWIQAPWDLTGDAALADLHQRIKADAASEREVRSRRAA